MIAISLILFGNKRKRKKYDWVLHAEARKKKRAVVKYFYLLYMNAEGELCLSPSL